jgi:ATP-dependent RNA helicase DeaD
MRLPTLADVAARRVELLKESIRAALQAGGLDQYLAAVEDLSEEFDLAEIAAAAMKLMAEKDGKAADGAQADGAAADGSGPRGMTRLFVEVGRKQNLRPSDLVGAIANEARVPGSAVGNIDIYDQFTFVDVELQFAPRIIEALSQATIRGQRVKVDIAKPR